MTKGAKEAKRPQAAFIIEHARCPMHLPIAIL